MLVVTCLVAILTFFFGQKTMLLIKFSFYFGTTAQIRQEKQFGALYNSSDHDCYESRWTESSERHHTSNN